MNRRRMLQLCGLGVLAPLPTLAIETETVSDYIRRDYDQVKTAMLGKRRWLNNLIPLSEQDPHISPRFLDMGECVVVPRLGGHKDLQIPIKQLSIPMIWDDDGEARHNSPKTKALLAKTLIKQALFAHDNRIAELWIHNPHHRIVFSNTYFRYLWAPTVTLTQHEPNLKYTMIQTAFAVVPVRHEDVYADVSPLPKVVPV